MKRNTKTLLKFLLISAVTVVCTVLLYRIVKNKNYIAKYSSFNGDIRQAGFGPVVPESVSFIQMNFMSETYRNCLVGSCARQ